MSNALMTICPICDSKKIKKVIGDLSVCRHRIRTTVRGVVYYLCQNCGEILTDAENEIKIDQHFSGLKQRLKKAV